MGSSYTTICSAVVALAFPFGAGVGVFLPSDPDPDTSSSESESMVTTRRGRGLVGREILESIFPEDGACVSVVIAGIRQVEATASNNSCCRDGTVVRKGGVTGVS